MNQAGIQWAEYVNPVMDAAEASWYAKWTAEYPDNCPCNEPGAWS